MILMIILKKLEHYDTWLLKLNQKTIILKLTFILGIIFYELFENKRYNPLKKKKNCHFLSLHKKLIETFCIK